MAQIVRHLINHSETNGNPQVGGAAIFNIKDGALMCNDEMALGHNQANTIAKAHREKDWSGFQSGRQRLRLTLNGVHVDFKFLRANYHDESSEMTMFKAAAKSRRDGQKAAAVATLNCRDFVVLALCPAGCELGKANEAMAKIAREVNEGKLQVTRAERSMISQHKTLTVLRSKVAIVGDARVGKSSLVQMFNSNGRDFPKNYVMTIGIDFCVKMVTIPGTTTQLEMYLFDCAGQSIFNQREHGSMHFKNTSMMMVVYDVGNRESFSSCAKWVQLVRSSRTSGPIPGVLIANKSDFFATGRAKVKTEEGMEFAKSMGLTYFETSAMNGDDVDAPFNFVADSFHRKYEEHLIAAERACAV